MNKYLKLTSYLIVAILATIAIFASNSRIVRIENSTIINSDLASVEKQIRYQNNFPNWSPFLKDDPEQKHYVTGIDGSIGSSYNWEGVAEQSKGKQTLVDMKSNYYKFQCEITIPFEANPTFEYYLKESNGKVELTQVFTTELKFPANAISHIINLKEKLTTTNQTGLTLLKSYVENNQLSKN